MGDLRTTLLVLWIALAAGDEPRPDRDRCAAP